MPIEPLNLGKTPRFDPQRAQREGDRYVHSYLAELSTYLSRALSQMEQQDDRRSQADSDRAWTISNDATDRSFDANAAAAAVDLDGLKTVVGELADATATLVHDLEDKEIIP